VNVARLAILVLAISPAACEQYHPTAPSHIRPASERDRDFAAKVGAETSRRRVVNTVETRAGGIVEPMLDKKPGLTLWRLSVTGPVAVAEGAVDGRAFAGIYWTRDDRIIRRRELLGAPIDDLESFAPKGRGRLRAAGDMRTLESARGLVAGEHSPPSNVRFRDAATGRDDGGAAAVREILAPAQRSRIEDAWSIDDVVAVLTPDSLWVIAFDELAIVEISRYPR
jgi:hypothetical protein